MAVGPTRIQLCGRLEVSIDGVRVEDRLRGRQGRLLLAFLVLNRDRAVRRDEVMEAIWSDGAAPGADALAPVLSRLRTVLGAGRLEGRAELRLQLGDGAWVDWEALAEAVAGTHAAARAGDWRASAAAADEALAIAGGGLLPG